MDPELKLTLLTLASGIFAIILLLGFSYSFYLIYKYVKASGWPKTDGEILKSKIVIDDSGDSVSYEPAICYSYSVNGLQYHSDTVYLFNLWQTKKSANYLVDKFKVGDEVEVFFNPKNPQDAMLITGFSGLHFNAVSALILVFLLGGYFLIGFVQGLLALN